MALKSPRLAPAGPWANVAGRLTGAALAFVLQIVLARTMTQSGFAEVAVILAWVGIATALSTLSMPLVVVRYTAEYLELGRVAHAHGVLRFAAWSTLTAASLLAALGLAGIAAGWVAPGRADRDAMAVGALLLLPMAASALAAGWLQGLKQVLSAELLANVGRLLMVLAGLLVFSGIHDAALPPIVVLALQCGAATLSVAACVLWGWRHRPAGWTTAAPAFELPIWRRAAAGFLLVMLAAALQERIDLLALGWFGATSDIAVYAVASRFTQTVLLAAQAVAATLAPEFSARMADIRAGRAAQAQALVRRAGRHVALVAVGALIVFAATGPWLLAPFGADYLPARWPMLIAVAGLVLASLFGPAVFVATLLGHARIGVASLLLSSLVNLGLSVVLVPKFGAVGAALATATSYIGAAALAWAWTRRVTGIDCGILARAK